MTSNNSPGSDHAISQASVDVYLRFLLGSTLWYFTERSIHVFLKRFYPEAYQHIVTHSKIVVFVALCMASIVTTITAPICLTAFLTSSGPLNFASPGAAEYCLGSRGLLWTQELFRLGNSSEVLKHHTLALLSLGYVLKNKIPAKGLYGLYASLITEVGFKVVWIFGALGNTIETSLWARRIETMAVALLLPVRWPTVLAAMWEVVMMPAGAATFAQKVVCLASIAVYATYFTTSFVRRVKKLGLISGSWFKPGFIGVGRLRMSIYGLCVSLGFLPSFAGVVYLHDHFSSQSKLAQDLLHYDVLGNILLRGTIASIVGSWSMALICDAVSKHDSVELSISSLLLRRFYVQGAVIGGGLAVWISPELGQHTKVDLLASIAVVLPLYEAIGRIGCHFAGCCHGILWSNFENTHPRIARIIKPYTPTVTYIAADNTATRKTPLLKGQSLIAVQLAMAIAYAASAVIVMVLLGSHVVGLVEAGTISMLLHGSVRILAECVRGDDRALMSTRIAGGGKGHPKGITVSLPMLFSLMEVGLATALLLSGCEMKGGEEATVSVIFANKPEGLGFLVNVALSIVSLCICYGLSYSSP